MNKTAILYITEYESEDWITKGDGVLELDKDTDVKTLERITEALKEHREEPFDDFSGFPEELFDESNPNFKAIVFYLSLDEGDREKFEAALGVRGVGYDLWNYIKVSIASKEQILDNFYNARGVDEFVQYYMDEDGLFDAINEGWKQLEDGRFALRQVCITAGLPHCDNPSPNKK